MMVEERKREQEMERQERQRLEEILNMCAEYEQQVQREKIIKNGSVSSEEANAAASMEAKRQDRNSLTRIKTNGSLPRLTSPTQGHKDMNVFDFRRRRSSNSSEDDFGSENGTIKRKPPSYSSNNGSDSGIHGNVSKYENNTTAAELADACGQIADNDFVFDDSIKTLSPTSPDLGQSYIGSLSRKLKISTSSDVDTKQNSSSVSSSSDPKSPRSFVSETRSYGSEPRSYGSEPRSPALAVDHGASRFPLTKERLLFTSPMSSYSSSEYSLSNIEVRHTVM